jgi:hypothetical protein
MRQCSHDVCYGCSVCIVKLERMIMSTRKIMSKRQIATYMSLRTTEDNFSKTLYMPEGMAKHLQQVSQPEHPS